MRIVIGLLLAIVLCGCGGGSGDANGIGPAGVGPSPAGHWLSTTTGAFDIFSTTAGGYIAVFSDKWGLRVFKENNPELTLESLVAAQL